MGIFSKLFKKPDLSLYQPQNRLEELLEKAADDPAARPEFLKQLFHFDLLVLGELTPGPQGERSVRFITGKDNSGTSFVFAFTSQSALEHVIEKMKMPPQKFVGMKALELFNMVNGQGGISLNSSLPFGKFFAPHEVSAVLNDSQGALSPMPMPAGTKYYVGQPEKTPLHLLEALARYLNRADGIVDIYFGLHTQGAGSMAYLLAVDLREKSSTEKTPELFNDIASIAKEVAVDLPIDMVVATENYRELLRKGALRSIRSFNS